MPYKIGFGGSHLLTGKQKPFPAPIIEYDKKTEIS